MCVLLLFFFLLKIHFISVWGFKLRVIVDISVINVKMYVSICLDLDLMKVFRWVKNEVRLWNLWFYHFAEIPMFKMGLPRSHFVHFVVFINICRLWMLCNVLLLKKKTKFKLKQIWFANQCHASKFNWNRCFELPLIITKALKTWMNQLIRLNW